MRPELLRALRELKKREVETFAAKVISVDKTKKTCQVEYNDLLYSNVRLAAVSSPEDSYVVLYPALQSDVIVSPIGEDVKNLYVEVYSKIDTAEILVGQTLAEIDSAGFSLKKGDGSLRACINELIDLIVEMSFTVTTPDTINGNTTVLNNAASFETIRTKFNDLLKPD